MMPNEKMSLEESVAAAATEMGVPDNTETETSGVETPTEEVVETAEETEVEVDEETAEALQLLRALKDPTRSTLVVEHLARQAGLLKPNEELTSKQEKQIKKGFREIAKKHLGDDFAILSEKMGDILEEALAEKERDFEEKLQAVEAKRAQQDYQTAYDKFLSDNKVTEEDAGIMLKLADKLAPGPKATLDEYLGELLSRARGGQATKKLEIAAKRKANNQAKQGENLGVDGKFEVQKPKGPISPLDAVLAAARGIRFEE
jgi:hypothetical protein